MREFCWKTFQVLKYYSEHFSANFKVPFVFSSLKLQCEILFCVSVDFYFLRNGEKLLLQMCIDVSFFSFYRNCEINFNHFNENEVESLEESLQSDNNFFLSLLCRESISFHGIFK